MTDWALVPIGNAWRPSDYIPAGTLWFRRTTLEVVRLGDVAKVLSMASPLTLPLPQVAPENVHERSGQVLPVSSVMSDAVVLGGDLREGDVLVPKRGRGPCVLVTEELRGIAFSSFLVVRTTAENSMWLCALLSSESGAAMRSSAMSGAMLPSLSSTHLADLMLPAVPRAGVEEVSSFLPAPAVLRTSTSTLSSVWEMRDLRTVNEWSLRRSSGKDGETSLGELGTVRAGRVDAKDCLGTAGTGRVPVLLSDAVRGRSPVVRLWALEKRGPPTTDATVVFTRSEAFRVALAPPAMLLSKELLALDVGAAAKPNPRKLAESLAVFFSTTEGRARLADAAAGVIIRHLSISSLRSVMVSIAEALTLQPSQTTSLAERLEHILARMLHA